MPYQLIREQSVVNSSFLPSPQSLSQQMAPQLQCTKQPQMAPKPVQISRPIFSPTQQYYTPGHYQQGTNQLNYQPSIANTQQFQDQPVQHQQMTFQAQKIRKIFA